MALVLKDRVKEVTSVTSTGTATLLGAVVGFQSFNTAVPSGSVVYYCIAAQSGGEWEVGYGTFTAPDQLSRTSVYDSSSAGALVNFSAGTKDVFITYPAEQAVYQETNGDLRLIDGVIEVSLDGTTTVSPLPNVSFQAFSTIDSYMQANQQNFSSGNSASADYVVTADNGTDSDNYVDLGMGSSGYNYPEFSASKANDAYLLNAGNQLVFISGKYGANSSNVSNTSDIVFVAGSFLDTEERMRIKSSTGNIILSSAANPTDNGQKLQVVGAADISNNVTIGGTVVVEGAAYSNAANITALNQLATKAYVDNATAAGLHIHQPVLVATTGNLVAIYDQPNGAGNGVGATLTNNTTQETITIDNTVLSANNRVLVYQQSNAVQNGVYVVTNTGSNATNWVLTRSSDADTSSQNDPNSLGGGDYFYVIDGDTQAGDSYVCTSEGNITFGTTLITFSQFSAAPEYTGAAPINVSGQTISLSGVVDVAHGGTNTSSYTAGDLLYASGSTTLNKLALGTSGQALIVSGSAPAWGSIDLAGGVVSGVLPAQHGGTDFSSYTIGNMLYANTTTSYAKISPNQTTTKKFLGQTGDGSTAGGPVWEQPAASDITGLATSATTDTSNASNITSGTLPAARLSGEYTGISGVGVLANGTWAANTIAVSYGGTGATNSTDARSNLGLTIGANVQAYSATLATVAALSTNGLLYRSAANTVSIASAADIVAQIGSTAVTNATNATNATTATTATSASNLTGGNITGNMIVANATSPNSYYLQFGDNTGWVYRFMTNVSGTPTVRFSFQDNGAFTAVNNVTAYSDERLKKNWRPVQEGFIENLAQVKSGIYDRTDIEATQAGVSAQDMQKLLAETVQTGEDGTLSLAYGNAALVAAIELAKQVVELKKEIELLKAR